LSRNATQEKGNPKMLEQKIEELTAAIKALTAVITQTQDNPAQTAVADVVKTNAPAPKIDAPTLQGPSEQDVKDLTLARSREGHKDAIREKLASFEAKKIGDLSASDTSVFYDWIKSLGGK
jgi:hypothetical protein